MTHFPKASQADTFGRWQFKSTPSNTIEARCTGKTKERGWPRLIGILKSRPKQPDREPLH